MSRSQSSPDAFAGVTAGTTGEEIGCRNTGLAVMQCIAAEEWRLTIGHQRMGLSCALRRRAAKPAAVGGRRVAGVSALPATESVATPQQAVACAEHSEKSNPSPAAAAFTLQWRWSVSQTAVSWNVAISRVIYCPGPRGQCRRDSHNLQNVSARARQRPPSSSMPCYGAGRGHIRRASALIQFSITRRVTHRTKAEAFGARYDAVQGKRVAGLTSVAGFVHMEKEMSDGAATVRGASQSQGAGEQVERIVERALGVEEETSCPQAEGEATAHRQRNHHRHLLLHPLPPTVAKPPRRL